MVFKRMFRRKHRVSFSFCFLNNVYLTTSIHLLLFNKSLQLVLLICGLIKVGKVIRFLSHPVMTGFTSGAAFYIGMSQLKYVFGIKVRNFCHIMCVNNRTRVINKIILMLSLGKRLLCFRKSHVF